MRKILKIIATGLFFMLTSPVIWAQTKPLKLWYNQPANSLIPDVSDKWQSDPEWVKALPIGNGYLGAMVFGDVEQERIQLNEKSLWSGSPSDNNNPDAAFSLNRIRELLFQGKYQEATKLAEKTQVCKGNGSGGGAYGSYQSLGDLRFQFTKNTPYSDYHRELDLNDGVARVSYSQNGILYKRAMFASYPDRAILIRFESNKQKAISFEAKMTRDERFTTHSENDQLIMTGTMDNGTGGKGLKYAVRLKAIVTGSVPVFNDGVLKISNADKVTLIITASTDYRQEYPKYRGDDPLKTTKAQLSAASKKSYFELLNRHFADYKALFNRVKLGLSDAGRDTVPTDVLLKSPSDPYLQQLYFQYGRYLLIASSRKGTLPANLQGIWANKKTPWNGDYHTNINVQMNYWAADAANLSDCFEPFERLVSSLVKPGEVTARVQYGLEGWCVEPITNVWGYTSPGEGLSWGMYVAAGGWLGQQMWDHYSYTHDLNYLRRIYPVLTGSARFYLGWLVKDPVTGKLVSGPSTSPENMFIAPDGSKASLSMGPAHDQEVIYGLFDAVLKAAAVLKDTSMLIRKVTVAKNSLKGPSIGKDGRLMEWGEEFQEIEPAHRHVSHLYGLYPGIQIDPLRSPELARGAKQSLIQRGDNGTGWSLAWKINFWARLKDGDHAKLLLDKLLHPTNSYRVNMADQGGTYPNLFCGHPPFQIDGNFGATAGICELLLQSDEDGLELLPALPSAWAVGEVSGLKARGGFVVDMLWKGNKLSTSLVRSIKGKVCRVITKQPMKIQIGVKKYTSTLNQTTSAYELVFPTLVGKIYELSPAGESL